MKKTKWFNLTFFHILLYLFVLLFHNHGVAGGTEEKSREENSVIKKLEKFTKSESLTLEGVLFFRYWYDIQDAKAEEGGESEAHTNSFELWRAYFGIKSKLTPWLSMRFLTDVGPEKKNVETSEEGGHTHYVNGDQDYHLFIKFAWFQINFIKELYVTAGVIDNIFHSFLNNFWGYRFVYKNMGDEEKLWERADLGGSLKYELPRKIGEISVALVNGSGYKNALDTNTNKTLWVSLILNPLAVISKYLTQLYAGAFLQYPVITKEELDKTVLISGFLGYKNQWIGIGYQPLGNWTRKESNNSVFWGIGHGIYFNFDTPINLGIFARGVFWDSNIRDDSKRMKYQFLGGLSYKQSEFLRLALSTMTTWFSDDKDPSTEEQEKEIKLFLNSEIKF